MPGSGFWPGGHARSESPVRPAGGGFLFGAGRTPPGSPPLPGRSALLLAAATRWVRIERTINDLDVDGLRVLVRADLTVPLDGTRITDDTRIRASLPTLNALISRGARVIVCAHLGRPGGKPDPAYSLAPVAARLGELLGGPVVLAADTIGPYALAAVAAVLPGGVVMLENLRFNPGESSKDDAVRGAFADRLAALADVYVCDGFGVVHRKHASVYDVPLRLPHAAGYLVAAETAALDRLTGDIQRPYVVVLGGAKVADKIGVVGKLITRADTTLIGGGMGFTLLAAQGYPVGASQVEDGQIETVRGYLDQAGRGGGDIVLPADIVVAAGRGAGAPRQVGGVGVCPRAPSPPRFLPPAAPRGRRRPSGTGPWACPRRRPTRLAPGRSPR